MRVLIVGCGYVGLSLGVELVRQGHAVFGLKRSADDAELKAAGITPLHADITLAESLTGLPRDFDWVVNCTASGGGGAEAYRKLYLEGNRNLIKWLTASDESERTLTSPPSPDGGEGSRRPGAGETGTLLRQDAANISPSPHFAESAEQDGERAEVRCSTPPSFDWQVDDELRPPIMGAHRGEETYQDPSPSLRPPSPHPTGRGQDEGSVHGKGEGVVTALIAAPRLKKFIYTSSTSVYGQNDGSLVTEADVVSPPTETSQVLVAAENLLLAAASDGASLLASREVGSAGVPPAASEGTRNSPAGRRRSQGDWREGSRGRSPHPFPVIILRLAGIYGPGRGHWFKQFLRGDARLEGDGSRLLNMIHRDDVVGAIITALQSDAPAPSVFNVVDDEPVMQRDFFAWLAGQLDKPMPPSVPADAEANRKRGVTNKRVSNERLKKMLGCQFKYPTFREGYAEEIGQMHQGRKAAQT